MQIKNSGVRFGMKLNRIPRVALVYIKIIFKKSIDIIVATA